MDVWIHEDPPLSQQSRRQHWQRSCHPFWRIAPAESTSLSQHRCGGSCCHGAPRGDRGAPPPPPPRPQQRAIRDGIKIVNVPAHSRIHQKRTHTDSVTLPNGMRPDKRRVLLVSEGVMGCLLGWAGRASPQHQSRHMPKRSDAILTQQTNKSHLKFISPLKKQQHMPLQGK